MYRHSDWSAVAPPVRNLGLHWFRSALFRSVPRRSIPRYSTTTLNHPQLFFSRSLLSHRRSQFRSSILGEQSRRAVRRRRAASSLFSSAVPDSFSRPPPHPLHLLLLYALPVSLSNRVLTLSPPFFPGLATSPLHTPHSTPRMRLLIVLKCRYRSTPLCRLDLIRTSRAVPIGMCTTQL